MGIVSQETHIFAGTIKENILYANKHATEYELIAACKKANIYDFISNLPDKFDTDVGPNGLKLSGGQKQRCAAARAIITNPKIVLADEPTGALDSKSAKQLLMTFDYLHQKLNATILMVTHDAFTASYADRIIFIKDGKIFNELVKGNDTRKQFFEKIIEVQTLLGGDLNDVI